MGDSRHRCALLLSRGIHAFAPWSAIRGSAGISLYLIEPSKHPDVCERHSRTNYVYLTPNLDAAIWGAELAVGEGPSRVYIVEPIGQIEDVSDLTDQKSLAIHRCHVVPASRYESPARSRSGRGTPLER